MIKTWSDWLGCASEKWAAYSLIELSDKAGNLTCEVASRSAQINPPLEIQVIVARPPVSQQNAGIV
jgi:hypothetical protein